MPSYRFSYIMPVGDYTPYKEGLEKNSALEVAEFAKQYYGENPIGNVSPMFSNMGEPVNILVTGDDFSAAMFEFATLDELYSFAGPDLA